ncbi:MAG: hypothetical protein ACKPKO_60190, partial [Candidatus Fonsibacter sp.]
VSILAVAVDELGEQGLLGNTLAIPAQYQRAMGHFKSAKTTGASTICARLFACSAFALQFRWESTLVPACCQ